MDAMGSGSLLDMETVLIGLVTGTCSMAMVSDFFHGPVQHNTSDAQGCVDAREPLFIGRGSGEGGTL